MVATLRKRGTEPGLQALWHLDRMNSRISAFSHFPTFRICPRCLVLPLGNFRSVRTGFLPAQEHDGPYILNRSEEHTSELQSLMRISYAVFCLNKKTHQLIK